MKAVLQSRELDLATTEMKIMSEFMFYDKHEGVDQERIVVIADSDDYLADDVFASWETKDDDFVRFYVEERLSISKSKKRWGRVKEEFFGYILRTEVIKHKADNKTSEATE